MKADVSSQEDVVGNNGKSARGGTGLQNSNLNLRLLDVILSFFGLLALSPLLLTVLCLAGIFQRGNPFFLQQRLGREEDPFMLIKFRSMKQGTQSVGTHGVNPLQVTRWGKMLRSCKLDELPQLWNVLKGEMSLVGPRPCLPNQDEVIQARRRLGVFQARPGLTGLSQVRGVDMSQPELLAKTDAKMIQTMGVKKYFLFILLTLAGHGKGDRVFGGNQTPN